MCVRGHMCVCVCGLVRERARESVHGRSCRKAERTGTVPTRPGCFAVPRRDLSRGNKDGCVGALIKKPAFSPQTAGLQEQKSLSARDRLKRGRSKHPIQSPHRRGHDCTL